jgi:hypothetical protein
VCSLVSADDACACACHDSWEGARRQLGVSSWRQGRRVGLLVTLTLSPHGGADAIRLRANTDSMIVPSSVKRGSAPPCSYTKFLGVGSLPCFVDSGSHEADHRLRPRWEMNYRLGPTPLRLWCAVKLFALYLVRNQSK